jgi:hypothetical protein
LDDLPTTGSPEGRAFRDLEMEKKILEICQTSGIGAQFGGKYLFYFIIKKIIVKKCIHGFLINRLEA